MDRLNFNHFYYFYVVAKEGSIKEAADKLHVSQPTISDQIRLLEEYFQAPLFERRNRALFLTRPGELALTYAERIFELANEVTAQLRHPGEVKKKSIDIGITYYMSQYFVYETILPLFKTKDVAVNIKEGQRHQLLADLEEGLLDLVFTDNRESLSSRLEAHRIGKNIAYAIAHKKFAKTKKGFPESLSRIPYFSYTSNSYLKFEIDLFFSKNSISPKIIGEGDDVDILQTVTENALAFTIVPEPAKQRFCRNSEIIILGEIEELETTIWGIVRKNQKGPARKLLRQSRQ